MNNVAIVTPLFPTEEKPYYCVYLYQQIQELKKLGNSVTVIQPTPILSNGLVEHCEFRGVAIERIGLHSNKILSLGNILPIKFCKAMEKLIQCGKYDIVSLSLTTVSVEKAVINICKKYSIKSVTHCHGLDVFGTYYLQHRKFIAEINNFHAKMNFKKADGIIGVSNKVCEVVKTKINKNNIFTVYNGADPEMFYPRLNAKADNSSFTILCVANMNEIKGWRYLIEAIRKVSEEKPDINLRAKFIGKGPLEEELKQLAEGLPIEFMGEQDYPVVAEEMRNADFYIMPSYYEAIGCVYLEAMLTGTATLGVCGCGIDEIIQDRINGYLVSPKNSDEIAECIKFAIDNPEKHREIAQRGYETVRDNYTWQHSAKTLDAVFKKLLKYKGKKKYE